MKYLITGGLGFIGSNLSRLISKKKSNQVLVIDSLAYSGNKKSLPELNYKNNLEFIKTSILNKTKLEKIILDFKPDRILHLAAESHVDKSIDSPDSFINTNIIGTYNLLEISRKYQKQNLDFLFMHISTDEVFGDLGNSKKLFKESSNYDPSSPYSASKASSDHLVRAWGRTYGLNYIISNCSNNYGPYQYPEKLIPHIILSALKGLPLPIYGDGLQIRDWLHVEDHVECLELLSKEGKLNKTYLIGGNNQITNLDIVKKICFFLDKNLSKKRPKELSSFYDLITFVSDRPGHDRAYGIDTSSIKKELGWKPKISFDKGLAKTVDWYIINHDWWKPLLNKKYKLERIGKK